MKQLSVLKNCTLITICCHINEVTKIFYFVKQTAYFGDVNKVVNFFSDIGMTIAPHYNPADFICEFYSQKIDTIHIILMYMICCDYIKFFFSYSGAS